MTNTITRAYKNGILFKDDFPLEDLSEYKAMKDVTIWVDFVRPTEEQMSLLADELGLHPLAVEDALHSHQRPKVDYYDNHLFVASHAVSIDEESGELITTEVDSFLICRCLITVRKGRGFPIEPVLKRWKIAPESTGIDVGFLLYGFLDVIIDGYITALEQFDDYYDEISDGIFGDNPLDPTQQKEWFQMRRSIVKFHRIIMSMREAINVLVRREHNIISDEMLPYFHDIYDHILRVTENTDTLRELIATIVDTNISLRDYRQNQIVKKVTSWAAIIAVPTLITGYYGMNVPYPGFEDHSGVYVSTGLMAIFSFALYWTFHKKDWI